MAKVLNEQEIEAILETAKRDSISVNNKAELDGLIKMFTQAFDDGKRITYHDNGIDTISINIRKF